MSNWQGCIPYVGAIIERKDEQGNTQVLIQTRMNNNVHSPKIYNGTIEFAAGVLDKAHESVYEAIVREIKEETGLTVKKIIDDDKTEVHKPQKIDGAFGFRPYCCTQQLIHGSPWVGFIFRCEVEDSMLIDQEGETRDVRWISLKELFEIFKRTPERLFTLEVPAWEYYFKDLGWL